MSIEVELFIFHIPMNLHLISFCIVNDTVSSKIYRARGQAVSRVVCDRTRKYDPSWDSNHTPSAIRADVLSPLD